jgi:hypothetical protein
MPSDAPCPFGLTRVERFRHHTDVGTHLAGRTKARRVIEHGDNRFGQTGTDAGNDTQQLHKSR